MFFESHRVTVTYGPVKAVEDFSFKFDQGRIICLLGANGAGKSSLLKAISGLTQLASGEIYFEDQRIDGLPPHHIAAKGIALVPEGRKLFPEMTVLENLEMGSYLQRDSRKRKESQEEVLNIFTVLRSRLGQRAGTMSGGEQQMTAIARALMSRPRLLLMDEPTLGLSPILCDTLVSQIVEIHHQRGTSMLLGEQRVELALLASHEGYVLNLGKLLLSGNSQELAANDHVRKAYFGI